MATSILFDEQIEVPLGITSLEEFRHWARSDEFPERGRIDFIRGRIEVDMAAEDLFFHGTPKTEFAVIIGLAVREGKLGHLFIDRTRLSNPAADLSVEPDFLFVSYQSLRDGRVKLIPKRGGKKGRYIEVEGSPDLTVEIVSDSSENKDTRRLPEAYYDAGVREFWLVDVRGEEIAFQIHRRGASKFEPVETDPEGFQASEVLSRRYRLTREPAPVEGWVYHLDEAE